MDESPSLLVICAYYFDPVKLILAQDRIFESLRHLASCQLMLKICLARSLRLLQATLKSSDRSVSLRCCDSVLKRYTDGKNDGVVRKGVFLTANEVAL